MWTRKVSHKMYIFWETARALGPVKKEPTLSCIYMHTVLKNNNTIVDIAL